MLVDVGAKICIFFVYNRKFEFVVVSSYGDGVGVMTGESTRLDCSGIDNKYRSEGRYNHPRRRATKISYTHSGSYENDLALAVQESLLMAKQAEAKKQSAMEENTNIQNCGGFPNSPDENKILEKNRNDVQSSKYLKELLLINLDLVQHQQEMLTQRDKEIKKLKSENDNVSEPYVEIFKKKSYK